MFSYYAEGCMESCARDHMIRHFPQVCARGHRPAGTRAGLCIDEGGLSFVTVICFPYRDDPYQTRMVRGNAGRPSSKPAAASGLRERPARAAWTGVPSLAAWEGKAAESARAASLTVAHCAAEPHGRSSGVRRAGQRQPEPAPSTRRQGCRAVAHKATGTRGAHAASPS